MSDLDDLKAQVARSCQILGRLHMTREPAGHVSARIPGTERVLIKARGRAEAALSYVEEDDLCIVDMDGKFVEGREGLAAPNEVYIHTCILKARPEINSVIHIHPQNIVAFTIAEKPLLPIVGAYSPAGLRLITDGLPLYPRSVLINSEQRGEDLVQTMGNARICLMRGHGITSCGATVEEATLTAINLNDVAELQWKAELLGGAKPIPDEDLADFSRGGGGGRAAAAPSGPWQPNSEWRYYDRMLKD
jgi:L-fuculose-phosphate aldolase